MDGGSTPPKSTILCLTNRQFEMEQKKKRNYGKMTAAVNLVKSENSGVFGVKDIRSAFKDLGVPMYSEFATTLVQQGVLVQAGLTYQDGFSWSRTEPIHINKVVELMTITRKKLRRLKRCLKKYQFMNVKSLYQLIRLLIRLSSYLLRMVIEFLNLSQSMRR